MTFNFNNLSQTAKETLFDAISKEVSGQGDVVPSTTPVNAVAATATLTSDTNPPTDTKTVTIGDVVYTFVTALTTDPAEVPYEVLIGTAAESLDNLKSAINGTAGEGTTYGTGTVAHPLVSATTNTDTSQIIAVKIAGDTSIDVSTDDTSLSWDDTVTTNGVNGTVARAGQIYFDTTNLYIATADNTVAGANWKKLTLEAIT